MKFQPNSAAIFTVTMSWKVARASLHRSRSMVFSWHYVASVIAGFTLVAPFGRPKAKANADDRTQNVDNKTWSESRFDTARYDYL